ncbi:hypothetical protein MFMK1_000423 [Metallumcola ferriviriculae]|uniref:Metal-dependent hydrolase n=1 Tax=Metallumcola ferriviriculae TaxID=3039180 RepID=A0AAU0UKF8_9FIRM|nr:hypothetical protein MFMK1_000423 [Desulfitibacteraceae bacterium MK1]
MDTFSHGFWLYLLFNKCLHKDIIPFIFGSVVPDLGLFTAAAYLFLTGKKQPGAGWLEAIYSNPAWRLTDEVMHSLFIWAAILILGIVIKNTALKFFGLAAAIHILIDILTHTKFTLTYLFPLPVHRISGWVNYLDPWFLGVNFSLVSIVILYYLAKHHNNPAS